MAFLFYMAKERFIGAVKPFHNILNGLAPKSLPFWVKRLFDFRDMLFQLIGRKVFSIQTVISTVHRNAVIPDGSSNVDTVIQVPVLFVFIQFELVRLDDGTHIVFPFSELYLLYHKLYHKIFTVI